MESLEQFKQQGLKDKRLLNRLRLVTTRVKDVERERIWAIAKAHTEGGNQLLRNIFSHRGLRNKTKA